MRILHGKKSSDVIPFIARDIINIERNKKVFEGLDLLLYPWNNYLDIEKNGVIFNVSHRAGIICIPQEVYDSALSQQFMSLLNKELQKITKN